MKWPVAEPPTFIPTHVQHTGNYVTMFVISMFVRTRTIRQQCNSYIKGATLMLIWIIKEKRKFVQSK